MRTFLITCLWLIPCSYLLAENPVEVGKVSWGRDFKDALDVSAQTGKPVLALFQEVPGCAGCQQFGREVLSEPLLVEAIETEFVPVLIYNNRRGYDAELLDRFHEPAWNYQVIRFFDSKGNDIIPRKDRVWTLEPLAARMIATLEEAGREVPAYLRTLAAPTSSTGLETAAFAMFCYWTGEMKLGQIPGVYSTEAGWLEGREVTRVLYHPDEITFPSLVEAAAQVECANKVYPSSKAQRDSLGMTRLEIGELTDSYRPAPLQDQKRQLQGTPYASLNLTPLQATKVNAWDRVDPGRAWEWLSPRQLEQLKELSAP